MWGTSAQKQAVQLPPTETGCLNGMGDRIILDFSVEWIRDKYVLRRGLGPTTIASGLWHHIFAQVNSISSFTIGVDGVCYNAAPLGPIASAPSGVFRYLGSRTLPFCILIYKLLPRVQDYRRYRKVSGNGHLQGAGQAIWVINMSYFTWLYSDINDYTVVEHDNSLGVGWNRNIGTPAQAATYAPYTAWLAAPNTPAQSSTAGLCGNPNVLFTAHRPISAGRPGTGLFSIAKRPGTINYVTRTGNFVIQS